MKDLIQRREQGNNKPSATSETGLLFAMLVMLLIMIAWATAVLFGNSWLDP